MNQKRKSSNFGASSDKRQKTSSDTSEIIESGESEASPEFFAGEIKETDCDRRGRHFSKALDISLIWILDIKILNKLHTFSILNGKVYKCKNVLWTETAI